MHFRKENFFGFLPTSFKSAPYSYSYTYNFSSRYASLKDLTTCILGLSSFCRTIPPVLLSKRFVQLKGLTRNNLIHFHKLCDSHILHLVIVLRIHGNKPLLLKVLFNFIFYQLKKTNSSNFNTRNSGFFIFLLPAARFCSKLTSFR